MDSTRTDADRSDVDRVLAGETAAFEGIVRRWQGPLVTLAYRFCRHPARAEELAQEAFVRAFRSLGRWRGDAAFSTWLFAIALNVCRSDLRRSRPPEVPIEELQVPASDAPGDETERRERDEIVRRAVKTLPSRYRDAVVLYYFCETDVIQAAAVLGIPTGTCKARLHRARALLKQRLSRMMP